MSGREEAQLEDDVRDRAEAEDLEGVRCQVQGQNSRILVLAFRKPSCQLLARKEPSVSHRRKPKTLIVNLQVWMPAALLK